MKIERCCECNEPTGAAGPSDGSRYTPEGYGPLCETCDGGAALDKARAENKRLVAEVERMRQKSYPHMCHADNSEPEELSCPVCRERNNRRIEVERLRGSHEDWCVRVDEHWRARVDALNRKVKRLRAKAELADKHAAWIRRGPPLDHGNTKHDEDWYREYAALDQREEEQTT